MIMKKIAALSVFIIGILSATASACPPVTVGNLFITGHRWIRPSTGPNTAAYLTITNPSGQPDKLIKVECEDATIVELHAHIDDKGVMKMRPVPFIEIGKDPVTLEPGGLHIMLMSLKNSFQGKKRIPLTLHFEKAGKVILDFPVKIPEPAKAKPTA